MRRYRYDTSHVGENLLTDVSFTNTGSEPVTTSDVKSWAKIETDADDTLIGSLITQVIDTAERQYEIPIVDKDVTAIYEQYSDALHLPYSPIKSITDVNRLDEGSEKSVDTDDYYLQGNVLYIFEQYRTELRWYRQGLKVEYKAGWDTLPESIKLGLKQAILSNYEDREDIAAGMSVTELPHGSHEKFNRFRNY